MIGGGLVDCLDPVIVLNSVLFVSCRAKIVIKRNFHLRFLDVNRKAHVCSFCYRMGQTAKETYNLAMRHLAK